MATQWPQQIAQQYQQFQPNQQPAHFQHTQYFQQPQYQQPQHFHQGGQFPQASSQQYGQPQQSQQPGQYVQNSQQQYQQPAQNYPQYQQYQQQQGHYSQAQPHPNGQYPPAQFYQQQQQQQPQQSTQPEQHQYSGQQPQYQQQYPPQQYPAQPPVSQNQIAPQFGVHQQSYQQQASPTNGQVPSVSVNHSCFNCGAPNHFAQDCPEPKRSIPAGALDPRKYANPLRRSKPGGAVVTKFAPPSHGGQYQNQPSAYPQPIYVSNDPSQHQGAFTPTNVNWAQSPADQQAWQQYWQYQAYQQSQPQQQGAYNQQQPQAMPATETGMYAAGYEQPSHPNPQAAQYDSASQIYHGQHPHAQYSQAPTSTAGSAEQLQIAPNYPADLNATHERQRSGSLVSAQSQSTQISPQKHEYTLQDPEEDDLDLLDIPDAPHSEILELPNTIVSPPVTLIGMPLPANFVVADALYPMSPPAPEVDGRCQSKYLRDVTSETLCEHINLSKYWRDHKDDTVFLPRPDDSIVISIDEVRTQIRDRYLYNEANDDGKRQARSNSRSVSVKKDPVEMQNHIEKIERDIAEMKAKLRKKALERGAQMSPPLSAAEDSPSEAQIFVKEEQGTPPQSARSDKVPNSAQETEDLLAALGVTGPPKPVTATNGPYHGMTAKVPFDWQADSMQQQRDLQLNGSNSYSPGSGFPPPPPPPPPYRHPSIPDGLNCSPNSGGPNYTNGQMFGVNSLEHSSGRYNTGPDGETLSPNESQYENPSSRKRSHNHRDSTSDEDDNAPARRQEDDVTPKLKRRQPKVAAAYSRRW